MKKVIIVGAGLSGLLTAYLISRFSWAEVTIIESGESYRGRLENLSSDLLSGQGGAGTVFGGKFCLPPASSGVWKKTGYEKKTFENFMQKCIIPFLGRNLHSCDTYQSYLKTKNGLYIKNYDTELILKTEMNDFVLHLLSDLTAQNVIMRNRCEFCGVEKKGNRFLIYCRDGNDEKIEDCCDYLVIATGRFSADQVIKWISGMADFKIQNPDLGIRFTMPISEAQLFRQIGRDVKIKGKIGRIGVRTFCVCSGGDKVLLNMKGMKYYDGHFDDYVSNKVNLGILGRSQYIFGFEGAALYCSCLRNYLKLDLSMKDFVRYSEHLINEINVFNELLSGIKEFILILQKDGILGSNLDKYPIYFPSVDKLNPEILVSSNFNTKCPNLYVIGDAVGISRGYIQSMWSAYCASNNIILKLNENGVKVVI